MELRMTASHPDYEDLNLLNTLYALVTNAIITVKYGDTPPELPVREQGFEVDMPLPELLATQNLVYGQIELYTDTSKLTAYEEFFDEF